MKYVAFLLLSACKHSPFQKPEPLPIARACIDGKKLDRSLLDPLAPLEVIRIVDAEGREHRGAKMVVTPESFTTFFDYIERLERDREQARTGCVAK